MTNDWLRSNAENMTVRPNCGNAMLAAVSFQQYCCL